MAAKFPNDGRPWALTIRKGLPLLILSCSATKRPIAEHQWVRFIDLYDGPMWRQVRAAGYPDCNVAALSAGYGFLEPAIPIKTYDTVMDDKTALHFCRTGDHIFRLAKCVRAAGSAMVFGGALYREIAIAAVERWPDLASLVTYAEGTFLQQRAQLGRFLTEHTPATAT